MCRPPAENVLLPEFAERIILQPHLEIGLVQSPKYRFTALTFYNYDIFRLEVIY